MQTEEEVHNVKRNRFTDMGVPLIIYMELVLTEITSWVVDPRIKFPRLSDMSIIMDGCPYWIEEFLSKNGHFLKGDMAECNSAEEYWLHHVVILVIEFYNHRNVALFKRFSRSKTHWAVLNVSKPDNPDIFELRIRISCPTRLMVEMKCDAGGINHNFQKKFVKEFRGMTLCVGFFEDGSWRYMPEQRRSSNLTVFVCRRVYDTSGEVYESISKLLMDNVVAHLLGTE